METDAASEDVSTAVMPQAAPPVALTPPTDWKSVDTSEYLSDPCRTFLEVV